MLHAVIIDDEANGVKSMELLVQKFVPDVKIVAHTTSPVEGIDIINNYRPDIVFLDINMPVLNGFQMLENLEYKQFCLIFTTAHREYGLKALKKNATDYLLKPVDIEELKMAVERAKKKLNNRVQLPDLKNLYADWQGSDLIRVPLPAKGFVEYTPASSIIYLEAQSNTSKAMLTNNQCIEVSKPLKEYETLLCKSNSYFIRIHNSFIINVNHVVRYLREDGGYAVMQCKKTIPISKNKKDEFLKAINLKTD